MSRVLVLTDRKFISNSNDFPFPWLESPSSCYAVFFVSLTLTDTTQTAHLHTVCHRPESDILTLHGKREVVTNVIFVARQARGRERKVSVDAAERQNRIDKRISVAFWMRLSNGGQKSKRMQKACH